MVILTFRSVWLRTDLGAIFEQGLCIRAAPYAGFYRYSPCVNFFRVGKLFMLGLVVSVTFGLIWIPFIGNKNVILQVIKRIFPLGRGIYEVKHWSLISWECNKNHDSIELPVWSPASPPNLLEFSFARWAEVFALAITVLCRPATLDSDSVVDCAETNLLVW